AQGPDPGAAGCAGHAGTLRLDPAFRAPPDVPGPDPGAVPPRWQALRGPRSRWHPERKLRPGDPRVAPAGHPVPAHARVTMACRRVNPARRMVAASPQRRHPMPYDRVSELPESVRDHVPKHAQEI